MSAVSEGTPAVVVYSTAFCAPCQTLKSHLTARGFEFVVKDPMMDEEAADFLESNNIRTTPVLTVGEEMVIGYDAPKIDELLARYTS